MGLDVCRFHRDSDIYGDGSLAFPDFTSCQAMVEECSVGLMLDMSQQGGVAVSGGM